MPALYSQLQNHATSQTEPDTRSRILTASQRLFRRHGYHATGLNDILEMAHAPKGSMYHHFPGGKEAIGVCVIEDITHGLLGLFLQSRARSAEAMITQVGEQLVTVMEKTHYEICAILSSFNAERQSSPLLGAAVTAAYGELIDQLQLRLQADGIGARLAKDKAITIVALLEGGSLLSQSMQDSSAFRLSVKQASALCRP